MRFIADPNVNCAAAALAYFDGLRMPACVLSIGALSVLLIGSKSAPPSKSRSTYFVLVGLAAALELSAVVIATTTAAGVAGSAPRSNAEPSLARAAPEKNDV